MNIKTLKGKLVLVTGASSGIGLAIAEKLASEGCGLVLTSRGERGLVKTATQLRKRWGVPVLSYSADVTQGEELLELVKKVKNDVGSIDFLVNNVGGGHVTSPNDWLDVAFMQDIELNLHSTHLCCRLLSPLLKNGGAIVNMSSLNGEIITSLVPGNHGAKMGYAVAKAGVIQLTQLYAVQLAERKIRVNVIAPGPVYPTKMTEDWSEERQLRVAQEIPLGRLGTTDDVANAVYFLVSDLSSYITGHTLDVNGGRGMR